MVCVHIVDRHQRPRVEEALDAFRVVVLHGARQCGKTTLARLVVDARGGTYVSLDDDAERSAALDDPLTFLTERRHPLAVDEVQLGGDRLVRAVKRLVDEDATPGRFLLAGSTNFLTVPTLSESLAGRARILRLRPFSEAELAGTPSALVDRCFDEPLGPVVGELPTRTAYLERLCRGGFPEVVTLNPRNRPGWFESYLETVTQRDLLALGDIRKDAALPRLLRWTAAVTGGELNISAAARDLAVNRATVTSYLEWLQTVFLINEIPAWSRNLVARASRRSKLYPADTGLAAGLLGLGVDALRSPTSPLVGGLVEAFVVNEIARQASAAHTGFDPYHYRDHQGHEVDLLLERNDGAVVAFAIKASRSPTADMLRHVRWLRDRLDSVSPGLFRGGYLLHTGDSAVTVGDRLYIRPIASLWLGAT